MDANDFKRSKLPPDLFPDQMKEVRRREISPVRRINIDLSTVIVDQPFHLGGNFFYVWQTPGTNDYVNIKVNNNREIAAPYYQQTGQMVPFDTLYISTPAGQTGTMIILYGTEWPELVSMIDNRAAVSQDIADLLNQLEGDAAPDNWGEITAGAGALLVVDPNANRKSLGITSDVANTGFVYLGFTNAVTTRAGGALWFHVLQPGGFWSIDDYQGAVYCIATAANQYIGYAEV